jgi:hypothetical protein
MAPEGSDTADRDARARSAVVSRRDVAKVGMFAGGALCMAPRITTMSFARKIVGSVPPPPSQSTTTVGTQDSTVPETTTSTSTSTTTIERGGTTTSIGENGSTTSTVRQEGSTTVTTECKPGNGFGDKNHCHTGPPGQAGQEGDPPDAGQSTGSGSGNGVLAFTGANSLELALLGAGAAAVGRVLYDASKRRRQEVDGPSRDGTADDAPTPRGS